jgi:hypothetical protein
MSSFNPRGGGSDWRGSQSYTSSVRGGGYAPRGGRGRGGRGGWKSWTAKHTPQPEPDIIRHPLGELLHTFSLSDIKPEPERFAATAQITDLKYVSSYNWLDGKAPTIMVPGKARFLIAFIFILMISRKTSCMDPPQDSTEA